MSYPENPELMTCVIADAENDAPRLVYADWLEEHGDPDRAEFIRVQCALADKSPGDEDYVDLLEREADILPAMRGRRFGPKLPEGIRFDDEPSCDDADKSSYERGFPYFAQETLGDVWRGEDPQLIARRLRDALAEMVATTTLRGLQSQVFLDHFLHEILDTPVAARISGLRLNHWSSEGARRFAEMLASSPATTGLRRLTLNSSFSSRDIDVLARSNAVSDLRHLKMRLDNFSAEEADRLLSAPWIRRLQSIRLRPGSENTDLGIRGLARLPDLHTLEISGSLQGIGSSVFDRVIQFPKLEQLFVSDTDLTEETQGLARADLPKLSSLVLEDCERRDEDFVPLCRSPLFGSLRLLCVSGNRIGSLGIANLAQSTSAATLRILRLGGNLFGSRGLAALATPGKFPNLTTLDLSPMQPRNQPPTEGMRRFLNDLQLPKLRYLALSKWPVDDCGAQRLAGNSTLARLTRLDLDYCPIGPSGGAALFASPYLQRLVYRNLLMTQIGPAVEALADRAVMPNLRECWLPRGMPDGVIERLQAARGDIFV